MLVLVLVLVALPVPVSVPVPVPVYAAAAGVLHGGQVTVCPASPASGLYYLHT